MHKPLYTFLCCFFASLFANAQVQLKGKIVSQDNAPVFAALVTSKVTGTFTETDLQGNFVLTVSSGKDTITVTHVSYKTKQVIKPEHQTTGLVITLEHTGKELEEIIVSTGLQRLPKERATGSFTLIDNKLINEQVGSNLMSRLQYVTNSFTTLPTRVTGGNITTIRGLSTFSQDIAKPLIIVDNFEYQGDIGNINPNDVENVTFLKDAAAGSIWGAKAANGVIVITTKKGGFNKPTRVELNSNITIGEKPDLFYNRNMSSGDYIDVEKFLFEKGFYNSNLLLPQFYPLSPVVNLLDKAGRGLISQQQADEQINSFRSNDIRHEYSRYFYQQVVNQQYAVNVSGGSKNIGWLLSAGFDKNKDELNAGYTRYNFRVENVYAPVKNLEITTSAYYTQSNTANGRPAFGSISAINGSIAAYTSFADANGNPLPVYTNYNSTYTDTAGNGKLLNWNYYPLNDYKYHSNKTQTENLNTMLGVRYKINKNITADVKYRYQRQHAETEYLKMLGSFAARNMINLFTQINNGSVVYKIPKGDILDLSTSTLTAQNLRAQLNYSQKWTRHEVTALAGSETSETVTKSNSLRTYGYNADILTYGNVDHTNTYPVYPYGYVSFIPNGLSFSKRNNRIVSLYGNAAYTFLNRYTVSASARRDASNLFGLNTNDKWKPLWSAGLSWELSKEAFYKATIIPYLRLKVTYGYQGNIDPSKVASTTIRYSNTNPLTLTPWSVVDNYYNPDLKWEQVGMFNTSVEWASKNRRLSGSIEYYEKRMTDLYVSTPMESTMGVGVTMIKNAGKMSGRGWDIEVNSININSKFQWTSNFILNTYTDKITKAEALTSRNAADMVGGTGSTLEGYSIYTYFAFPWAGLDPATGDPLSYLNGHTSKDYAAITSVNTKFSDLVYVGSLTPRLFGSLGNSFSLNGLTMNVRVIYKFNYYFRRESIDYNDLVNQSRGHSDYSLRWQKPGDENFTTVPSFVYPVNSQRDRVYTGSEVLATKGDHIRLQYINISYDLKKLLKKTSLTQAAAYVVINNVGLIWKANRFGIDPEYNNSTIPPARNYAFGLKVTF